MNQEEIKRALNYYRYNGNWTIGAMAKACGLSAPTIKAAMTTHVSEQTQARLSVAIPLMTKNCPTFQPPKNKPGHKKKYMTRYARLMRYCYYIEKTGQVRRIPRRKQSDMTRDKAAFICTYLDYVMKFYLLEMYGKRLEEKKIYLGDCYPAENWARVIFEKLPGINNDLFKKIYPDESRKNYK